ncbi:MAG: hypothetical protein LBU43_08640 [Candidatus Accumulibacter sp.]|jgi:uncharacterized membrane protein|nr:hypothetical protein [Accumulibacter sp.]
MSSFPIPASAFYGHSRAVEADAVFAWLRFGWNVFLVNPGVWVVSTLILLIGFPALLILWPLGPLLAALLTPVLAAGLFGMCRQAAGEKALGVSALFAGFTTRTTPLLVLGIVFMVVAMIIPLIVFLLFSSSVVGGIMWGISVGITVLLALLLSSLLFVPLWMTMWFAPALVLFNAMPPLEACKASLSASLKNIRPLLILGLIVFILCVFAALPAGLGFLVLIPVLAGTAYASYQDVFIVH